MGVALTEGWSLGTCVGAGGLPPHSLLYERVGCSFMGGLLGDSSGCTEHSAQGYRLGGLSWAARALADGTTVPTLRQV